MDAKKPTFDEVYIKVLSMVNEGLNISDALKTLKYDRGIFYQKISKAQKAELQIAKTAQAEYYPQFWPTKPKQKK